MEDTERVCTVSNCFHDSRGGCVLLKSSNSNELIHKYNSTLVTLSTEGGAMMNLIPIFTNKYKIRFPEGNQNGSISTVVSKNAVHIEQYVKSIQDAIHVIILISEAIAAVIKYTEDNSRRTLYPQMKSMFDCYIESIEGIPQMGFYRPSNYSSDLKHFLCDFREAVLALFEMVSNNRENKVYLNDGIGKGQNQKFCNLKFFCTNSRLLDCSKVSCFHIRQFGDDCSSFPSDLKDLPVCRNVWRAAIKSNHSILSSFKCKHPCKENMASLIQEAFGRTVKVHTLLCIPHELLSLEWYHELIDFFRSTLEKLDKNEIEEPTNKRRKC